jgi:hypothetical protein
MKEPNERNVENGKYLFYRPLDLAVKCGEWIESGEMW